MLAARKRNLEPGRDSTLGDRFCRPRRLLSLFSQNLLESSTRAGGFGGLIVFQLPATTTTTTRNASSLILIVIINRQAAGGSRRIRTKTPFSIPSFHCQSSMAYGSPNKLRQTGGPLGDRNPHRRLWPLLGRSPRNCPGRC